MQLGLPRLGVRVSLAGLITLMVLLAAMAIFLFWAGSRALSRQPVPGLGSMVGSRGKAATPLAPDGLVKIGNELWLAKVADGTAADGDEVVVVGQSGLQLTVARASVSR